MTSFKIILAAVSAVILFLFGLQAFSAEVRMAGSTVLRRWLERLAGRRWCALLLGAAVTAVIQSSSATTSLTVALVDAGTLSFRSSLGILLGANIGTASTAWLVSLKLTSIGPFFIVAGRYSVPYRFGSRSSANLFSTSASSSSR
jgi:phosphate:Na+ symporter